MTLTIGDLLLLILVAAIAGAIGQALAGYSLGGFFATAAVGFIGALIGVWLARLVGLPRLISIDIGGHLFPFVWSIVGSMILALGLGILSGRRGHRIA